MSNTLYEISKVVEAIHMECVDAEGVLSDDLEKRLDESSLTLTQKIDSCGRFMANTKGKIGAVVDEIKRLQNIQRIMENGNERFKEYVKDCMIVGGMKKSDNPLFPFTVASNPASVEITDESKIDDKYRIPVPATSKIDKAMIKEDLKAGIKVKGAKLITDKTNLRIG